MKKDGFTSAAIRFYNPIIDRWMMYVGRRHHEIIKDIHDDGYTEYYKKSHIDGFIHNSIFVSREDATKIAKSLGITMIGSELTSEDLW